VFSLLRPSLVAQSPESVDFLKHHPAFDLHCHPGNFPQRGGAEYGFAMRTLADFVDQTMRLVDAVGVNHVGLGTDMDSMVQPVFSTYLQLPDWIAALRSKGLSKGDVAKIAGGNALRVLQEVLKAHHVVLRPLAARFFWFHEWKISRVGLERLLLRQRSPGRARLIAGRDHPSRDGERAQDC
jgi:hypothetical protein